MNYDYKNYQINYTVCYFDTDKHKIREYPITEDIFDYAQAEKYMRLLSIRDNKYYWITARFCGITPATKDLYVPTTESCNFHNKMIQMLERQVYGDNF
jgi:hypothetical protein